MWPESIDRLSTPRARNVPAPRNHEVGRQGRNSSDAAQPPLRTATERDTPKRNYGFEINGGTEIAR